MQLALGYGVHQPADYRGLVVVMIEVVQIVGVQRPDAAQDLSERVTLDGVNLAVRVLPKSSYCVVHGGYPPKIPYSLKVKYSKQSS